MYPPTMSPPWMPGMDVGRVPVGHWEWMTWTRFSTHMLKEYPNTADLKEMTEHWNYVILRHGKNPDRVNWIVSGHEGPQIRVRVWS